ncbi:ectin-like [Mytilus galloprovincialis]|uniref:ectin-like n=1 Tax=Mytilus galloprovincialis TaxID=29158 RepID=UPI003F7C98AB
MKNVIKRLTTVQLVSGTCEDFNTTTEIKSFNTSDCKIPVDGGWSIWSSSSCSVTCGNGVITKTRACDNPTPSDSGLDCVGSETETFFCNLRKCHSRKQRKRKSMTCHNKRTTNID